MKRYLLFFILIAVVLFSGTIRAEELFANSLLSEVVFKLSQVEDFKGTIITNVYSGEEVIDYRTQVMKSQTRTMSQNLNDNSKLDFEEMKLLNSIPWIYLPPNYNVLKNALPLEGQLDYQEPLYNLDNLYNIELLGESINREREVYIIELENKFTIQRLFVDKERKVISKIEIFNGANIKLATINYEEMTLFEPRIWLPTKVSVNDGRGQRLMEVTYQNWDVNSGLTEFDFAKGFEDDYYTKIKQLKDKLKKQRNNDKLYLLLSDLYQEDGNLMEAANSLKNAIRINDNSKYRKKLIEIYQMQGRYREALGEAGAALQTSYNDAQLHYLLSQIQLQLGRINNARYSLEKATDLDPKNTLYLEKLFLIYNNSADQSGKYMLERAERVAKKLIELAPEDKRYRVYLGDVHFEQGEEIKAEKSYSKAIELDPEDTWGYKKLAQVYAKIDKVNKAEELYKYIFYLDNSLENQNYLADFYFEEGKYEKALREYESIKERSAANLNLRFKLAESYLATNNDEQGLSIFNQILEETKNGEFYLKVATIVKRYNLDAAIDIYHYSLKSKDFLTKEETDEVYRRLGYIYFEEEGQKELNKLDQLLKINSQANIYQLLGKYKFVYGSLEQAISYFKLALKRQENVDARYNLAFAYLIVGHYDLAKAEAEKLIELGEEQQASRLNDLINRVIELSGGYEQLYIPGRINRIKGDRLRQQGKLNQALIKYKESVFENYNYNLSYFYIGFISGIRENHLQLELAKTGLNKEEIELLDELLVSLEVK